MREASTPVETVGAPTPQLGTGSSVRSIATPACSMTSTMRLLRNPAPARNSRGGAPAHRPKASSANRGGLRQPLAVAELVDPLAALRGPADRMRVHAPVVAGGLQPGGALGKRDQGVVGAAVHLRDLWICAHIPAELRGAPGPAGGPPAAGRCGR